MPMTEDKLNVDIDGGLGSDRTKTQVEKNEKMGRNDSPEKQDE
jgi:hypothetical protein